MPNIIHIKAFGMVAERIGTTDLEMAYCPDSEGLLDLLRTNFPELTTTKFSLAINKKLISGNQEIPENAEIALLPPFSGG